ncbi:MAG: riboflavin synthase [Ignavibacteriaceae bacterium]|jgi:riboflavin synthase
MFTGLIEETGKLVQKLKTGEGYQITFSGLKVMEDLAIGSSISVNGVCLTVIKKNSNTFTVDAIEETLKKTNLGSLKDDDKVNLERPLKTDSRIGGHFVLGHVDTTGKIVEIKKLSNSHFIKISFPKEFKGYLIYVGSVAIDGVSMTVAELEEDNFSIGVIPHTWEETIFAVKNPGDVVNLEFDVLGKYVERIMQSKASDSGVINNG